jgi:polyribonucleotide nucleotidyltransferase
MKCGMPTADTPQAHRVEVRIAGTDCSFETGRIARQATSSVVARCGDNVVLATVVAAAEPKPGQSFFPLVVEYREKFASVGRIPGNYQRREGRISDHEILVSRLIDRTLRSLFPEGYYCEVQLQVQVMSAEPDSDIESLALLAAACAVHISPLPAKGPAAGIRVARVDGQVQPFPSRRQRATADLLFSVGVSPDGPVMLEGEAREVPESDCLAAMQQAVEMLARFQKAFEDLRQQCGTAKAPAPEVPPLPTVPEATADAILQSMRLVDKQQRRGALAGHRAAWLESLGEDARAEAGAAYDAAAWSTMREMILAEGRRIDGRSATDIRPIWCEVGLLPRAHGSAIFTRGETQAIVTCTLGAADEGLRLDGLHSKDTTERFLLHYNFPPYSVGEARPLRGPGRREIGHGSLARRGLLATLPSSDEHPFTIRIESEITESNGSSSMATVCGATLAMLHAGIALDRPVAGIAMGLVTDGTRHAVLSDILGDEDHLGDMDFKVVGTADGVTAIQLDNKVGGLSLELLGQALDQAKAGRQHILTVMAQTLAGPARPSRFVPRAERIQIMPDSIGALIGPRGANIKAITEQTGAKVSVEDDGTVFLYAADQEAARRARLLVQQTAGVLHKGRCYKGTVTGIKDFGAFVRINAVNEGLVPIEEIDQERPKHPGEVLAEGQEVTVAVLGADERGRLRLSRRQALGVSEAQIEF